MEDEGSNIITISINELPNKGRVNKIIIGAVAKYFNVEPENVKIALGCLKKLNLLKLLKLNVDD
jgi:uncharacterized protein YggU (UPF0235/DUF167 family)